MRTTKAQQAHNYRHLIRTAVDQMTQTGFEGTTMKQIARAAGLGDATIYKYFPTKEKLVIAFFAQAMEDALAKTATTPGLASFSLQERLQVLIDNVLDTLLADREFVAIARGLIVQAPSLLMGELLPGKSALKQAFIEILDQAENIKEIPPCGFKPSLAGLLSDYVYGVIAYWLKDHSEQFNNTTQMVDLSLGVVALGLRSGMVDKLIELGGFVLRTQLARLMQNGSGLADWFQLARHTFNGAPR
jgi:TetR/AcrR family transcriptional regulator, regulator of autoinduction and epiphytic fitness